MNLALLKEYRELFENHYKNLDESKAIGILNKENLSNEDLITLLNVENPQIIKLMATKAKAITDKYFGKTILLYAPLYISNLCNSGCVYCGFSKLNSGVVRKKLSFSEIKDELLSLKSEGLDSILILTGEDRLNSPFEYIYEACKLASEYFSEVSVEVYPLDEEEYLSLTKVNVIGLTIYQETYDIEQYDKLHLFGTKKDFSYRLNAPERAANAHIKEICIGPLLGLSNPKEDVFLSLLHAKYLMDKFPDLEVSISFPRFRKANVFFNPKYFVSDREFIKYIAAARLFLNRVGITISTRENSILRDALIGYGITKMSAGSKTKVGGYAKSDNLQGQFETEDKRNVREVIEAIKSKVYRHEFTNWIKGVSTI